MPPSNKVPLIDRMKRAGCWAVGLYAFAVFFALGMVISLLNKDLMRGLGGLFLTALSLGGGIRLAQRAAARSAPQPPAQTPTRTPTRKPRR